MAGEHLMVTAIMEVKISNNFFRWPNDCWAIPSFRIQTFLNDPVAHSFRESSLPSEIGEVLHFLL